MTFLAPASEVLEARADTSFAIPLPVSGDQFLQALDDVEAAELAEAAEMARIPCANGPCPLPRVAACTVQPKEPPLPALRIRAGEHETRFTVVRHDVFADDKGSVLVLRDGTTGACTAVYRASTAATDSRAATVSLGAVIEIDEDAVVTERSDW